MTVNNYSTKIRMPTIVPIALLLALIILATTVTTMYDKTDWVTFKDIVLVITSGLIGFLTGKHLDGTKTENEMHE